MTLPLRLLIVEDAADGKRAQAKIEFGTTRHDGNPAYFVRETAPASI